MFQLVGRCPLFCLFAESVNIVLFYTFQLPGQIIFLLRRKRENLIGSCSKHLLIYLFEGEKERD